MRTTLLISLLLCTGCLANSLTDSATSRTTPFGTAAQAAAAAAAAAMDTAGGIRRLTASQYAASINDVLGSDVALTTPLDSDVPFNNLESLGAGSITTTPQGASLYDQAARSLAAQRFADPNKGAAFVGCTPQSPAQPNDACVMAFVQRFGRQAWRRPLTSTEQANYGAVYVSAAQEGNSSLQGLQTLTAALLASPYFIYRIEIGDPQPDGTQVLNDYELATRLSYFLINTTPDAPLLAAAAAGTLHTPDELQAQAKRLLADPRAKVALTSFLEQWLGFSALASLSKDANTYPAFSPTLGKAMRQEFDCVVGQLISDPNADFTSLLTTRVTWLNAELAALYGLPAPSGNANQTFAKTALPADGARGGLLTLSGFLATQAKPDTTAPIARGHYVRTRLMCEDIQPPPANVDQLPPATSDGKPVTMRQRLAAHQSNPSCKGCHSAMDPLGLPLEHFDGLGVYRDTDQGLTLDVTGNVDGQDFDGATAMGALLQQNDQVQTCVIRQIFRQAVGSMETSAQQTALAAQAAAAAGNGFNLQTALLNFIGSDLFRASGATL